MSSQDRPLDPDMLAADEVRAFYERHPYPKPLTSLEGYRRNWQKATRRRADYHLLWPNRPYRRDLDVLIAGCGTSQAVRHALREPDSRVLGVDISQASLVHSRGLQQKYGVDNLELLQLNLDQVDSLGRSFDKIVCTGVLHHLPDPEAGLRALRQVLKPDGVMQLMVYANYGRTGIYMFQEYSRLLGIRPSESDLADLGATVATVANEHPLAHLMRRARDFRSGPALADALLNPQDRAYTVPQLFDWLAACDCSFGRWSLQAPYLPTCGVIAQTPHASRLAALPARQRYAALELYRGTMATHELTAYASEDAAEAQRITFNYDAVLDLVPIRAPGAVVVQERLPPGAAAVLINPMHRHTDIFLPIEAREKTLLDAIDGRRTLGEILAAAALNPTDRHVRTGAIDFIERLWNYDQIVIDGSGARCHGE
jgi:SAM-dependent methyltransferase